MRIIYSVLALATLVSCAQVTQPSPSKTSEAAPVAEETLGRFVEWRDVNSAFLDYSRHVTIWLPPEYDQFPDRTFDVLYMADGHNLFDPAIAYGGVDWGIDEALLRLTQAGVMEPVIVIGVWNTEARYAEYSPWHRAPDYAQFLKQELIPRVNSEFRTNTGPEATTHMGSSMGGLLSLYLTTQHSDAFGAGGCLSTHVIFSETLFAQGTGRDEDLASADPTPFLSRDIANGQFSVPDGAKLWFDYGTEGFDAGYEPVHVELNAALLGLGLEEGQDYVMRKYEGADHNELSWRQRLEDPLRFLYAKTEL